MVLSAGYGLRMRPLSLSLPKPAIPVLGRPLAVHILHKLARCGVAEAVLNLHHLAGVVRGMLGAGAEAGLPPIRFSYEETILGTAGGVGKAAPMLRGEGPILLCNCDSLADIDLEAVVEAHRRSGMPATLVLAPARPGYSTVETDAEGRVISIAGKPEVDAERVAGSHLFTGCHVIDEAVLDRIPADGPSDIVRDVYRPLAAEGRIGSVPHDGFWWEFGSPSLYLEGSLRLLRLPAAERRRVLDHDPVHEMAEGIAAVGTGAQIHETARVRGQAALGFASFVSEGVVVEDSVVMPEAWIGAGCRLVRTIVAPGVEVPAGFQVDDSVICPDPGPKAELPETARRVQGMLLCPLNGRQSPS
jgi:NDP-sugar pyrophosphorylase family protein